VATLHKCARGVRSTDCAFLNFTTGREINSHLSIFGRIDNLTDEHYAEVFGFPALGTAVYAGVKGFDL
jgi:outer membrane cobalamin receptor